VSGFARVGCGVFIGGVLLVAASRADAQQKGPPPKKGQAIEIRGQVPTPQVVTVRPREVPAYDRHLLTPAFYSGTGNTGSADAVQLVPESQVRGTTELDTLVKGVASTAATLSFPAARTDTIRRVTSPPTQAGASSIEMEAMRHELALRRSRLDSLQRAQNARLQADVELQSPPAKRRSAADSAARAQEIESIRRELEYRRQRLDSLQREVRNMGRSRRPAPSKTTTDSTAATPTPPRGRK
jgi:Skp family chaperone for outer membrane proteins